MRTKRATTCTLYIVLRSYIYNMGLRKPRELTSRTCQNMQHAAFKVFVGCTRELLYMLLDFQVSEGLRRGLIIHHRLPHDYIIITI